jgi:phage terminase large subunit GpA-like protein
MSWFFGEMCSETRVPGKGWEKIAKRNEAWDLFYYAIGACASSLLNVEKLDWDKPPPWAAAANDNPLVIEAAATGTADAMQRSNFDWGAFGKAMG